MEEVLQQSFITGVERVAAWADLLDSINVFPVADGDTGRNLLISLSPLRAISKKKDKIIRQLLLAARGNSGNIASKYFSAFYAADTPSDLAAYAKEGSARAWRAVSDPRPGTMLTVLDVVSDVLDQNKITFDRNTVDTIINRLEKAVHETYELLPKLKKAGVVDAGALGIYIFFEGFFYSLSGLASNYRPITEVFKNRLQILSSFQESVESGYCIDFVIKTPNQSKNELEKLTQAQKSVVITPEGDLYKIHLHTEDREKVIAQIATLGSMVNWEEDNLASQIKEFMNTNPAQSLHIMTDAAGSVTCQDAKKYNFTLLNSYLNVGEKCLPETYFHPDELYNAMRQGIKVSTSQASVFERHQFYASVLNRFEKVLYLCVGSVFTGNFDVATEWKKHNDPQNRLLVIDTGAASGRLGTIVLAAARYLAKTNDMEKTFAFAQKVVKACEEYVFLDKLQYLAAGGRLSKTNAFFGDMLKMKPVVSPQPEGAKKIGVVRNQEDQLKMAGHRLAVSLRNDPHALIMLEYSDNYDWVNKTVKKMLVERYPQAEIILQPLSLTSGAHMGPGTWAVAFLPQMD
jgi:DegV family protein with EDD domain